VVGPPDGLIIDPTAHIDPLVVADTTSGPVIIDREAVVTAFTRLEGPCYVGPGTHLHSAKVRAGTTLGPGCRIGGEVECSIVQGHSNKYHDGFLGHAYLGEWVNIGAGTNNSDLRNDYGEVVMIVQGRKVPTGLNKVGCFLGDHTKTGLATQLNTGTVAGAFCNILPGPGYAPRHLPSFTSWFKGELIENGSLTQILDTARTVMRRRQKAMSADHALLYRMVFDQTAAERRAALLQRAADGLRKAS
jgi:UDP-N-acetylglucosamine diphosphorylase/glucosamine-1-phosphate N-acetyltransferase